MMEVKIGKGMKGGSIKLLKFLKREQSTEDKFSEDGMKDLYDKNALSNYNS